MSSSSSGASLRQSQSNRASSTCTCEASEKGSETTKEEIKTVVSKWERGGPTECESHEGIDTPNRNRKVLRPRV